MKKINTATGNMKQIIHFKLKIKCNILRVTSKLITEPLIMKCCNYKYTSQ